MAGTASSPSFDPTANDTDVVGRVMQQGFHNLRFPEPLERQFRDDHRIGAHTRVRISLIVALITTTGFFIIDHWILHAENATPDVIRFGLQVPVILTVLFATSRRFYLRWFERLCYIGLPLFGFGLVIMAVNAQAEQQPLVASRLLLVCFYGYFMLGLRLRPALACSLVMLISFIGAGLLGYIAPAICIYVSFALVCANIIGSVGAYALEYASRNVFLERLQLEEMAARDGLTRLLNRQTFEFRARGLWRTATTLGRPLAVLMIDVDYFKRYNDHYGHQAGDECLRRIAAAVRDAVNPGRDELVARYGGEELIVLLVDRSAAEVEQVAAAIVARVRGEAIPHSASLAGDYVSVSVGACGTANDATVSYAHVANVADQALYTAKHQGRDRCVIFDVRTVCDLPAGSASAGDTAGRADARMLPVTNPLAGTTPASG
jgi:diguanylate cyclase (GGDEF)-like protein